jgi:hypothetical protein
VFFNTKRAKISSERLVDQPRAMELSDRFDRAFGAWAAA